MNRFSLVTLIAAVLFPLGCSSSDASGPIISCDSTANAGPCTGMFPCGSSGTDCSAATQVCISESGVEGCVDVSGASASACPSAAEAAALAGCDPGASITCNGSSSQGLTATCGD